MDTAGFAEPAAAPIPRLTTPPLTPWRRVWPGIIFFILTGTIFSLSELPRAWALSERLHPAHRRVMAGPVPADPGGDAGRHSGRLPALGQPLPGFQRSVWRVPGCFRHIWSGFLGEPDIRPIRLEAAGVRAAAAGHAAWTCAGRSQTAYAGAAIAELAG